jgi:hypothetical protein
VSTPVDIDKLRKELSSHPDPKFVEFLINGLSHGFDTLVSETELPTKECKNLQSAITQPETVDSLIESEIQNGFLSGPFIQPPFESYRVSPIGIAEGKYSKKKRLIVDLSAPHDNEEHPSVNDLIDKDQCSLSYVKLDDAIKGIAEIGTGTLMCKIDIRNAFKLLPIPRAQFHLFCIKWRGKYYHYTRLAFGCRSSPILFDQLAQAICYIAEYNFGVRPIYHLLDDFLSLTAPDDCADRTMAALTTIFNRLKVPMATEKTAGPTTVVEYLGIVLDSDNMQARLPENKLKRIITFIDDFLSRSTCTKRELLQLLGHMNFASRVILAGRSFVSYLIKLSTTAKKLYHYVHINKACREDLLMWKQFLTQWNGVSMFYQTQLTLATDIELYTDASIVGHGGYFDGRWFSEQWPVDLPNITDNAISMAFRELYPIVVAAILWGSEWSTKRILFHCDNMATVEIIRKGRSKAPDVMKLMRQLTWCSALHNFSIYANFIPGSVNVISDVLSRLQITRFHEICPAAQLRSCPCPPVSEVTWDFNRQ